MRFECDADLSDKGVKEAHAGGKALKNAGYKFDVAHTSQLQRVQKDNSIRNWRDRPPNTKELEIE